MERSHRPPPLTLTPPGSARNSSRLSNHSRISKLAGSFNTHTAPKSMFADDDDWDTSCFQTALRVMGDFIHILVCMSLLLIMAFFLNYDPVVVMGNTGPQAVTLIILLGLDILLDFRSIGRYDKKWKGWALAARTVFGISYIIIFITYAAIGMAFPDGYTYWDLSTESTNPLVYAFLWIIATWNLVYVIINRHQFARELKRYRKRAEGIQASRRERHNLDVEAGFKQMSEAVGVERKASVSTVSTTLSVPKPTATM